MVSLSIGFNPDLWTLESVCRRTIENKRGKIDIYIFYFAVQFLPFHVWDYEPVIVYESGNEVTCLYDALHYYIGCSKKPELVISYPWRSFYEGSTEKKVELDKMPQRELTDELIKVWRSRDHNPFSMDEIFLEDPWKALDEFRKGERVKFGEERERKIVSLELPEYRDVETLYNDLSLALETNEIIKGFKWPGILAEYVLSSSIEKESLQSFLARKCIAERIVLEMENLTRIEEELRSVYSKTGEES
jgi:hypothetical protein